MTAGQIKKKGWRSIKKSYKPQRYASVQIEVKLGWYSLFFPDLLGEACNRGDFSGKTSKKTIDRGELLKERRIL